MTNDDYGGGEVHEIVVAQCVVSMNFKVVI